MSAQKSKGGFKTKIALLAREVRKKQREHEKFLRLEEQARKRWTRGYQAFLKAADQLSQLTVHKTKKEADLKKKVQGWPNETVSLTKERDSLRASIKNVALELAGFATKLATLCEQEISETKTTDEIITQVFSLNATVVRAAGDREDCLKRHVFPRLFDESGGLLRQVSFTNSDGLKRVVAMVNSMTIVKGDLASEAKSEISKFFERFRQVTKMDESVKPLYELTRQLLVEKTDFKVGPDLYRFLAMELNAIVFPELARAQILLRSSIRSEKTTSYIRLYRRDSRTDMWEVVPQT